MIVSTTSSTYENKIGLDFIFHTTNSSDEQSTLSNNDSDDIGLDIDDITVIQEVEIALPNEKFEDDGDGFGDDDDDDDDDKTAKITYWTTSVIFKKIS